MEINVREGEEMGVKIPAVSLEISAEIAEKAEKLLSDFAEDAGLETALIVDRSGALVAGISSEEDVTVDVISGLVAGASSAMRALVDQLGDTGEIESLHQGGERLLYIREVVTRFILVGVSDASFPPGIVREKASQLQPSLADLLRDVKPLDPPAPTPTEKPKSLRAVAAERAAARVKDELVKEDSTSGESTDEEISASEGPENIFEETGVPDSEAQEDPMENPAGEEEIVPEAAEEEMGEDEPPPEPVEVLEPIDLGEPEIVIEGSTYEEVAVEESPFEFEPDEEFEEQKEEAEKLAVAPAESIFELEEEEDDLEQNAEPSVFEWVDDEEDSVEEAPPSEDIEETAETVFEFDATDSDEDREEADEISDSNPEEPERPEKEEEDDNESRSAGPLYF